MQILLSISIAIVAILHIAISIVEVFFWQRPFVYQRLDFDKETAIKVDPIVKNVGLYNGFLAAGLIWGLFPSQNNYSVEIFFLGCVIVAGIFGSITIKPTTLILQTIPAAISLILIWRLGFQV